MALNFPDSPTLNQVYTDTTSGFSYQWDGVVWQSYSAPASKNISIVDDISGSFDGSTQTFSLAVSGTALTPANAQQLRVVLGGIVQEPGVDYTVSGSNITFTTPPSGGLDCSIVSLGPAVSVSVPGDGTVTPIKLSTGGPYWNTDGDVVITGIGTTALLVNGNARVTGILTVGTSSITLDGTNNTINVGSLSISQGGISGGTPNINVGFITATGASISGNVSIAGTLTYEDVTNVDSVGLITARSGVNVTGGDVTLGTGVTISGATSNVFTLSTNGTKRIEIQADGDIDIDGGGVFYDATNNRLAIGTQSPGAIFHSSKGGTLPTANGTETGIFQWNGVTGHTSSVAIVGGSAASSELYFGDGDDIDVGFIRYEHPNNALAFATNTQERARIDSSGRLLVGTSSARSVGGFTSQLEIEGIDASTSSISLTRNNNGAGWPIFTFAKTRGTGAGGVGLVAAADRLGEILFAGGDGSTANSVGGSIVCDVDGTPGANDMPGRLVFSTTADGASSPTEHFRITQRGIFKFSTNGSYIDTGSAYNEIYQTNSSVGVLITNTNANPQGIQINYNTDSNGTGNEFIYCQGGATQRMTVRSNGGIANYSANNVNLCDEREKKNIETLDSTWGCLKNWELKKFHYNEDADTDDKRYGVIAQQVALHCPEVITEWVKQKAEDAVLDEDGNVVTPVVEEVTRMGVKEQQMYWMAIKALQEAQVRIEQLEAKVAALESA